MWKVKQLKQERDFYQNKSSIFRKKKNDLGKDKGRILNIKY